MRAGPSGSEQPRSSWPVPAARCCSSSARSLPGSTSESRSCATPPNCCRRSLRGGGRAGYPLKRSAFMFRTVTSAGSTSPTRVRAANPPRSRSSRAHFDNFIAQHAKRAGADLIENAMVHDVLFDDDGRAVGVRYEVAGVSRTAQAEVDVDTGGRGKDLARRLRIPAGDLVVAQRRGLPALRGSGREVQPRY